MADVPKLSCVAYRDADPDMKFEMDRLLERIGRNPESSSVINEFGREQLVRFRQAVQAIEKFLSDPTSPEAPLEEKDRLRLQYLQAAQGISLVLGAGTEALRRYDVEYVHAAIEQYNESQDAATAAYLREVAERREDLSCRLAEIGLPEKTGDFVTAAVLRIEAAEAFGRSIRNGLPLEEAITVKKSPLKLVIPKVPGAA